MFKRGDVITLPHLPRTGWLVVQSDLDYRNDIYILRKLPNNNGWRIRSNWIYFCVHQTIGMKKVGEAPVRMWRSMWINALEYVNENNRMSSAASQAACGKAGKYTVTE